MSTDTGYRIKCPIDSFICGLATGTTASCVTALFVDIHCRVSWSSVYSYETTLSESLWKKKKKNLNLFSQNYKYLSSVWFEDFLLQNMQCMQCKICNRKCFWSDNSFHIIDKLQSFHKRVNELSNDYLFLSCSKFLFLNISEILRSALCLLCLVLYLNYFREHILPPLHFLIISYASSQKKLLKCFRLAVFHEKLMSLN